MLQRQAKNEKHAAEVGTARFDENDVLRMFVSGSGATGWSHRKEEGLQHLPVRYKHFSTHLHVYRVY